MVEDLSQAHEAHISYLIRLYPGREDEIRELYRSVRTDAEQREGLPAYRHIFVGREVRDRLERLYGKPEKKGEESPVTATVPLEHHPRWKEFIRHGIEALLRKKHSS